MEAAYCVKRPGECDGTCNICPQPPRGITPQKTPLMELIESHEEAAAKAAYEHIKSPYPTKVQGDKVRHPSHYAKWKVEPITYIMENGMDFWRGNIIKYASRAGSKTYDGMDPVQSEITDLEKVRRYAEMRINQLRGENVL